MAGNNQKRLYLYLQRRDRKGMKLLSIFPFKECPPTRVTDLNSLKLPKALTATIEKSIYEDRMYWEPWIESADTYTELRNSLHKRKVRNVPLISTPKHTSLPRNYVNKIPTKRTAPEVGKFKPKKGMVRKNKSK
jgi:hypothetical protein